MLHFKNELLISFLHPLLLYKFETHVAYQQEALLVERMTLAYVLVICSVSYAQILPFFSSKICNFTPPTATVSFGLAASPCGEANKIFVGKSFPVGNLNACENLCKRSRACHIFTYRNGNCGLRSYQPKGVIALENTRIGFKDTGVLPQCDGKVFVGDAVILPGGSSGDCQRICQGSLECKSWTWKGNEELCVLNFGSTARILDVPTFANIVSGPRKCS